ncbi:hypothetical protein LguiA_002014 [Lonicera macranthoides]
MLFTARRKYKRKVVGKRFDQKEVIDYFNKLVIDSVERDLGLMLFCDLDYFIIVIVEVFVAFDHTTCLMAEQGSIQLAGI